MLDNIAMGLLREVADLRELPTTGAFNIRFNGQLYNGADEALIRRLLREN